MAHSKQPAPEIEYQNNPFFIATDGLSQFFKYAQSVAILMIIVSVAGFAGNAADSINQLSQPAKPSEATNFTTPSLGAEELISLSVIIGILILGVGVVVLFFAGISDYTASRIADKKTTTLKEAAGAVLKRFPGYVLMQIVVFFKIFLWSLLLLIPGIIMSVRYSLAGTSYFRGNMKPLEAISHSARITKGAWFTTFASTTLFNMITFGAISPLLHPGTNGILQRQYDAHDAVKLEKPAPHILSYLTLGILVLLFLLIVALVILAFFVLFNWSDATPLLDSSLST